MVDLVKFVGGLSEDDFKRLQRVCISRVAKSIKQIKVDDDIIEMWETDRVEALLEIRRRFPDSGLSELKGFIVSRVDELKGTK